MKPPHTQARPVLVTGATGRIGRELVTQLLASGVNVRALTRRADTAALPTSVEMVTGDLTQPESLNAALKDVETVFLLWTAPPSTVAAVIARIAERARRVVFLSSPHQTPHPFFQQPNAAAVLHATIEREITAAGLVPTILRPGMIAANALLWWAAQVRDGDVVRWPYAAAESAPVDVRDIAAVATRTICDEKYAGGDYVLTGPESLTHEAQVMTIGDVLGRRLTYEELSPDAFRRATDGRFPPVVVNMLLNAWNAAVGRDAYMTTDVAEITGRPARTFRQWAVDHADAFRHSTS